MPIDYSVLPLSKGTPIAAQKAKLLRREAKVKKAIRAQCMERDGGCRLGPVFDVWLESYGPCKGPLEWAHLGEWKRSKTRGMAPEKRHCIMGSLMLCTKHHQMYDAGELVIDYGPDGANGQLTVWRGAA